MPVNDTELNSNLKDKVVASATSSLKLLAIKFTDGTGLMIEATGTGSAPTISAKPASASELPDDGDAVCKVDWSWIHGSKIANLSSNSGSVRLQLDPAGPLSVAVQVWQGSSFLAFTPWKPA